MNPRKQCYLDEEGTGIIYILNVGESGIGPADDKLVKENVVSRFRCKAIEQDITIVIPTTTKLKRSKGTQNRMIKISEQNKRVIALINTFRSQYDSTVLNIPDGHDGKGRAISRAIQDHLIRQKLNLPIVGSKRNHSLAKKLPDIRVPAESKDRRDRSSTTTTTTRLKSAAVTGADKKIIGGTKRGLPNVPVFAPNSGKRQRTEGDDKVDAAPPSLSPAFPVVSASPQMQVTLAYALRLAAIATAGLDLPPEPLPRPLSDFPRYTTGC